MENEDSDTIDLTLECLMNRTKYLKYIKKTDPNKYKQKNEYYSKLQKYSESILEITETLMNDPKKQLSNELEESFHDYMRTCIKFLEVKELENRFSEKDEDTIFVNMEENPKEEIKSSYDTFSNKNYWGKKIFKK